MNKVIISVAVSLLVGLGAGYMIGQGTSDVGMNTKDAQASVAMMKDQTKAIEQMSQMMKDTSMSLQTWSTKYSDNDMMMKAKDMETIATKFMKTNSGSGSKGMDNLMK